MTFFSLPASLSKWKKKIFCYYASTGRVITCIFVYFSGYTCTHMHAPPALTHFSTNRMWSVRGDVIRGIVFSDSQREFPCLYRHSSDQTHGDTGRHKDRHKERDRKGNVLSHKVTDNCNVSHKPTCHLILVETYRNHTHTDTHILSFLPLKAWLRVTECLFYKINHWNPTSVRDSTEDSVRKDLLTFEYHQNIT